jgi:predicted membrane-bound mannosyltransferase
VARGGQPWYYYLLLIPLYEQIGVVFGFVGIARSLLYPTRFRLFLVYWFVGNVFIYSWAAEKMPWLMIHMTMPMMLLAAVGLEPAVSRVLAWVRKSVAGGKKSVEVEMRGTLPVWKKPRPRLAMAGAWMTTVLAVLLLLPTLQNMREVTYVHPADGPHEMMIYVQTTTDINIVMARLAELDQKLDGGKYQLAIGVTDDAAWPYEWYLRDYPNVCWDFPTGCAATASTIPVIITGGDKLYSIMNQYAPTSGTGAYTFHHYRLRTWWDEGYKPLPCVVSATNTCNGEPTWGGVGPLLWLSYGDTPPAHASFNAGLAVQRIWRWWWEREPFGSTDGSYDMGLFIRKDLDVAP